MPLVLKIFKSFLPAKMRNCYYRIHTSIPPCPPDTLTPLRYACGSSGSRAAPPSPADLPIPPLPPTPPPPQVLGDIWGGVTSEPAVVPRPPRECIAFCCSTWIIGDHQEEKGISRRFVMFWEP